MQPLSKLFAGKPLVIASHNQGKVAEIRAMIAPFGIEVKSASEANIEEPEETGLSFAENAELKACHAMQATSLPSLADDSGLVIPALDGAPGIYSARWAGPGKDFSVAFSRIQTLLDEKKLRTADAYFIADLCLCLPGGAIHHFEGRVDGTLTFPPRGTQGFGYDPIFIPKDHDLTFGEIVPEKKHRMSHRARAFEKFLHFLTTQQ